MIAHRGASAAFPEHTRAAMLHALAVGADGLECDVQLTRDREVVCWHDPTVDRTSDGRGAVADHTLDRLRGLDVVSWHARRPGAEPATTTAPPAAYGGAGEQVLTLADLLAIATAADRPLRLAVELKHPSPFGHELEERVLAFWKADDTFTASVERNPAGEDGSNEFVFYDGPPFANGLPHYGHLLTGYVKDLVARYQTQQGRRVERRFGWDTHGLPAELEAMKQLGMTDKSEIEAMGIDTFNDACRSSVLKYTDQWQDYVTRQARWVDFENDYKTLTPDFMESVIWAFSELHRKGLTYRGFRVLPYCWNDETPLSNHELRMDDDVYKMRQDPSVTVTFPITGLPADPALVPDGGADAALAAHLAGVHVLAWTTTPWTLPTNAALAVGPGIDYAVVPAGPEGATADGDRFLLAVDLVLSLIHI